MILRNVATLAVFVVGLLAGAMLTRIAAPLPASAQMPAAAPMKSAMPMPSGTAGCPMMQMHSAGMMKSPADRAYMGAMLQMHGGMMRMTLNGNADHDFLSMMIPHHQAAVAMGQTELQYGRIAKVRALATRIIAAQRAEIREMKAWLK